MPTVLADYHAFPQSLGGSVLCVGNFDGVHLGHAKMLATGRGEATRRSVPFTIMTFDPHPGVILRPSPPHPPRVPLTTAEQRRELLAAFDPDGVIIIPTTREFLSITAEDFLRNIVHTALGARVMVEGPTFTYGRGRGGRLRRCSVRGRSWGSRRCWCPRRRRACATCRW